MAVAASMDGMFRLAGGAVIVVRRAERSPPLPGKTPTDTILAEAFSGSATYPTLSSPGIAGPGRRVGSGDAADIILLQQDLSVLERGVTEGRRAFGNIMKFIMMAMSSNFGNMFSMAGATLILPFLPMLPVQILLNNLLYAVSEMPIPLDEVDSEITEKPEHWDMRFIRNFMLVMGPVSSIFDFLTFGLLLLVFHANEALFQTGWFVESLATQVLVIFVLRTRGNPLKSRPYPLLTATSLAVVVLAVVLPFTPLGIWFGFVPPSPAFLLAIAGLTVSYLALAQAAKWAFYRLSPPVGAPTPLMRPHLPLIERS